MRIESDSARMPHTCRAMLYRRDPQKNMARFYAMSIEPNLFGGYALSRRWGRIGCRGRECLELFDDEHEAIVSFLATLRRKRAKGYLSRDARVNSFRSCGRHAD